MHTKQTFGTQEDETVPKEGPAGDGHFAVRKLIILLFSSSKGWISYYVNNEYILCSSCWFPASGTSFPVLQYLCLTLELTTCPYLSSVFQITRLVTSALKLF